ncbi:hypothetical protein G8J22_02460 [Lentilactobacillus hilgardii]|uniref:hypothetical protein n=1 Tax=Lentilactobacillus hilgardii TaxID=1588 RepID=UPI00019C47A7|nr:hypothetical protein [Lentilactobacillus hilgardii]EEI19707.1 hypothetical protein HMPREF0497_1544 [Lentilactobacillus buchneri ATCC 11577]QIR10452.1 hypothetical protein G8J22_02460 [Lentilactobacillus hilgardii]
MLKLIYEIISFPGICLIIGVALGVIFNQIVYGAALGITFDAVIQTSLLVKRKRG